MSDFAEYDDMDALELAARVRRRELAGGDVLDAALARIARIDPQIRAVCLLAADAARAAIRAGLLR